MSDQEKKDEKGPETSHDPKKNRTVAYIISEDLVKASSLLPSNKGRSLLVHSLVKSFGYFKPSELEIPTKHSLMFLKPVPAEEKDLLVYHDKDYLDLVLSPPSQEGTSQSSKTDSSRTLANAEYGLEDDCPMFTNLPQYVKLVGGASLTAASALKDGRADVAICWDGGRHHAHKGRASGFCYVADCVLSVLSLKRSTPRPRIMYIDLDLHFSDAVSQAFASSSSSSTPTTLTLSIHHSSKGFFPVAPLSSLTDPTTKDPYTLSISLQRGASNETYYFIWHNAVQLIKEAFNPDMVVVQCGVDGLAGDPCKTFNWGLGSVEDEGSFGWFVQKILDWNCKTLLLGGGGYNSPNAARAWTYLSSIAFGSPLTQDADIPDHKYFPLYKPSFTLDVPRGNMKDENTPEYLSEISSNFRALADRIREDRAKSIQDTNTKH